MRNQFRQYQLLVICPELRIRVRESQATLDLLPQIKRSASSRSAVTTKIDRRLRSVVVILPQFHPAVRRFSRMACSTSRQRLAKSVVDGIKLFLLTLLASASLCNANLVPIGHMTFTGTFTLNHLYDFNHPSAQAFGTFSDQSVTGSSGIFAPFISQGDTLAGQALWTAS